MVQMTIWRNLFPFEINGTSRCCNKRNQHDNNNSLLELGDLKLLFIKS